MCSFTVLSKKYDNNKINNKVKNRGPDYTNKVEYNNFIFYHNLLHITGKKTIQPIIKNNIVILFNGEIYNYKDLGSFNNELELLHNLYSELNTEFISKLDGEFVIIIFDFNKNEIYLISDLFGTKPLWYTINEGIMISSYKRELLDNTKDSIITKLENNSILKLDIKSLNIISINEHTKMDLNQFKNTYDDWNKAFEKAVLKRIPENNIEYMIPISSGHDSGAITSVLHKFKKKYILYSIEGGEDKKIVNKRFKLNTYKNKLFNFNNKLFENNFSYLIEEGDHNYYQSTDRAKNEYWYLVSRDCASTGLSYLLRECKKEFKNFKVILTGDGADEIYFHNSMAKGKKYGCGLQPNKFPKNLETIYPWYNLFKGTQRRFLNKTELVGGASGIECRYPFLDKNLFQEFLYLKPELKNKFYKGPIENYLKINNYPYNGSCMKLGMNPLRNITNNEEQYKIMNRILENYDKNFISDTQNEIPRRRNILYREKWILL